MLGEPQPSNRGTARAPALSLDALPASAGHEGKEKAGRQALPDMRAAAPKAKPEGGGVTVEMLRFLPMRAYLAGMSLRDSLRERQEGQALVEYALLLSLIAVVSIVILGTLGHQVSRIFSRISKQL